MKNLFKSIIVSGALVLIMLPILALTAQAAAPDVGINCAAGIGLGNTDPRTIVANIIKIVLGFLGMIAVVMILIGGFKWMTAGGNTERADEARKIIVAAVIGLVIILAAYGITTFVIGSILTATQ